MTGPPNPGGPLIFGQFRPPAMSNQPTTPPPAYFLSLSLENVRSFGEKQTISFAREDGRPAQWTIILGDNGAGKTTVLKGLAVLRPMKYMERDSQLFHLDNKYNPIKFEDLFYTAFSHFNQNREFLIRKGGKERSTVRCRMFTGLSLEESVVNNKVGSSVEAKVIGLTQNGVILGKTLLLC